MARFRKIILLLLLAMAWWMSSGPVFAEEEGKKFFNSMDTNSDGKVSKEEAVSEYGWSVKYFEMNDLDEDGQLTLTEFETWPRDPRTQKFMDELSPEIFEVLDIDTDGKVQLETEWFGTPESFKARDGDSDGYLTKDEAKKKPKK